MAKSKVEAPDDTPAKGQPAPPQPPAARLCQNCISWDEITGVKPDGSYIAQDREGLWGICRAKAPIPFTAFNMVQTVGPLHVAPAVWPRTFAGENCGEWEAK